MRASRPSGSSAPSLTFLCGIQFWFLSSFHGQMRGNCDVEMLIVACHGLTSELGFDSEDFRENSRLSKPVMTKIKTFTFFDRNVTFDNTLCAIRDRRDDFRMTILTSMRIFNLQRDNFETNALCVISRQALCTLDFWKIGLFQFVL